MLVKISIDGREYEVKSGEKLLSVCIKLGVFVPHLCFLKDHTPLGKCGLCVVEIDNAQIVLSCVTDVYDGMNVKTNSEKIGQLRKANLEKILRNHNISCFECSRSGRCKLQSYASVIYGSDIKKIELICAKNDIDSKYFSIGENIIYDKSKCVYCMRCVSFLKETCGMDLKFVHLGDYSSKENDIYGNITDICPCAALKQSDEMFMPANSSIETKHTFDADCVYAPKIEVSMFDKELLNISGELGNYIRNPVKFAKSIISNRVVSSEKDYSIALEKMAEFITSSSQNKKVVVLGDRTDIATFCYADYLFSRIKGGVVLFNDQNVPHKILKKVGIFDTSVLRSDYVVFVGKKYLSDILYFKQNVTGLKRYDILDLNNIDDFIKLMKKDSGIFASNPRIVVYVNIFEDFSEDFVYSCLSKVEDTYRELFQIDIKTIFLPRTSTQILSKYLRKFVSFRDFQSEHNKHDTDLIYIAGVFNSKYLDKSIYTVNHSELNNIKSANIYINNRHFLEDDGYYLDLFGKTYKTEKILDNEIKSSRDFICDLIKLVFPDEFRDIMSDIKKFVRDQFFHGY